MVLGVDVTTVSGELNALTEVQPVVIGKALNDLLGAIRGFPECSECLLRKPLL